MAFTSSMFTGENQGPAPVKLAVSKTPTSRSRWPEEPVPYGHPNIDIPIDEETVVSRQHERHNRPNVQFNFENKEDALKIMDREFQESIYLVQAGKGDLEGSEVGSGVFQVLPVKST